MMLNDTYIQQGMSERGDIIDAMVSNMSEIDEECNKENKERDRRKELNLLQKQLDLSMRLSVFYGTF